MLGLLAGVAFLIVPQRRQKQELVREEGVQPLEGRGFPLRHHPHLG
jgi:hypothetical protein